MSTTDSKVVESQEDADENDQNKPDADQNADSADQVDDTDDGDEQELEVDFDPKKALSKIKKQNSELKGLRTRAQEAEKKVGQTTEEKDKEISDLQTQLLRERVGRKTGLPDQLVERLNGDDEESMLADAESLLEVFAKSKPPSTKPQEQLRGGGRPESEPDVTDVRKIAARMFDR